MYGVPRISIYIYHGSKGKPKNPDQDDVNGLKRSLGLTDAYGSSGSSSYGGGAGDDNKKPPGTGTSRTALRKRQQQAKIKELSTVIKSIGKGQDRGPKGGGKRSTEE